MFVNFFIRRPVFATVCALLIILVGAISIPTLAVENYPNVEPTTINVTANYTGASAEVVESAVTSVIERQINGVEGLEYISSTSTNQGNSSITATFGQGRDKDIAAVDIQNRVSLAQPQLPGQVNQTGVTVSKQSGNFVLGMGLFSAKGEYDNLFVSNYADLYLVDPLKRIPGVAEVRIFGERRYAMRLWLDPNRLASRNLTAQDVVEALREQNLQVGAGQIGQEPAPPDQEYVISLQAESRLKSAEEFGDLVLKTGENGSLVRLKDVGRAELGAQDYSSFLRFSGQDAVGLGVVQTLGSNALEISQAVRAEMEQLAEKFPPGLEYKVAFDTTEAVQEAFREVILTLAIAIALVVLVIYIFLQDWRTTLIPTITIPVSLVGTFAFMKLFGFSINSLTMFGLILATGLVVDDAIVVIENIVRLIEQGMKPIQAAMAAMAEVTGAVIATSLVLFAVFVPVAFFPGVTGKLYQQFALTIVFSIAISTFNALTLTPALSALLLRRRQGPQNRFFRWFNRSFESLRDSYDRLLRQLSRMRGIVVGVFVALLGITFLLFQIVPGGFVPDEDQGYFITIIQGPEGSSLNYTSKVMQQAEKQLLALPETSGTFAVGGFSFGGGGANFATIFTTLKPWSQRDRSVQEIITQLTGPLMSTPEALIIPINPPPVQIGSSQGGFDFQVQDKGSLGLEALAQATQELVQKANASGKLIRVNSQFAVNSPQLMIEVNRNQAKALQVSLEDIFGTLQTYLGASYVNDFNLFERTYRVYVQADQQFRSKPEDIGSLYVRSQNEQMIPMSNLVQVRSTVGPQTINHYNLFRSAQVTGTPIPGTSSGQVIKIMETLARETLPTGMDFAWSGSSLEEITSGGQAPIIFGLGLVVVFLVLAAQYESYIDPLIILFAVPLAVLGALIALFLRGLANDVYGQIGLVMLIGLASKNSILIVEFANQLRDEGHTVVKAAIQAAEERLRPILMTALSFIFGIFPLVVATGAGAAARRSLGTTVMGGMVVSTFLSLFVVPILYIVIGTARERWSRRKSTSPEPKREVISAGRTP